MVSASTAETLSQNFTAIGIINLQISSLDL